MHYGPWLVAVGVWLFLWQLTTAKTGWLPKPFFSPPHGLLNVYVSEWDRLIICIAYSLRLWALGFFSGVYRIEEDDYEYNTSGYDWGGEDEPVDLDVNYDGGRP